MSPERRRITLALLAAALCGCSETIPTVEVTVTGLTSERTLSVDLTLDGKSPMSDAPVVRGDLESFVLRLAQDATGTLAIGVDGLAENGCRMSRGDATVAITGPGSYSATVALAADATGGCLIRVTAIGIGGGTVTSEGGAISCHFPATQQPAVSQSVVCLASEPTDPVTCGVASFPPAGTSVTLTAAADSDSYFAGWGGACSGTGACVVPSASVSAAVRAEFLPRNLCHGQVCWEHPLPQGNTVLTMHAIGDEKVWAFGQRGLALQTSGDRWAPSARSTGEDLHAAWGSARDDVWAAGGTALLHWNGLGWTCAAGLGCGESGTGDGGTSSLIPALNALWGTASDDVWGVGNGGAVVRWDGSCWSRLTTGTTLDAGGIDLNGVFATASTAGDGGGATEVWAVGAQGLVARYRSATASWTTTTVGTGALEAVWGSGTGDVWAVGAAGAIYHWDGAAWSLSPSGTGQDLHAVWGTAADDAWAVGEGGTALHWNGAVWLASAPPTTANLHAVTGADENDVRVGGTGGTLLRWNGIHWTQDTQVNHERAFHAAWGPPRTTGTERHTDVWAAGDDGAILHWNGAAWVPVTALSNRLSLAVRGVGGTSSTEVWFVGDKLVACWDGTGFTVSKKGALQPALNAVWAPSGGGSTDLWIAGDGVLLRKSGACDFTASDGSGAPWLPAGAGALTGLWGSAAADAWAVGAAGTIVHWDGTRWILCGTATPSCTVEPAAAAALAAVDLLAVSGSGAADAWAVGEGGTIVRWNGTRWSLVTTGLPEGKYDLDGVWVIAAADVWLAGAAGLLLHYDGAAFSVYDSGTPKTLRAVWAGASKDVVIVGDEGTVLHYPHPQKK